MNAHRHLLPSSNFGRLGPRHLTSLMLAVLMALGGVVAMERVAVADPTFTVTSDMDVSDMDSGDGVCDTLTVGCTLRAAIEEANALPGNDTIVFERAMRIRLDSALVVNPTTATDTLTISGVGMGATIIDADTPLSFSPATGWSLPPSQFSSTHRAIEVLDGTSLFLTDLSIVDAGAFPLDDVWGGAVLVEKGDLKVEDVEFRGNAVGAPGFLGGGGAIAYLGGAALNISGSRFMGNAANGGGGAIAITFAASALIDNSVFEVNGRQTGTALTVNPMFTPVAGGAISTTAPLNITNSRFRHNSAQSGGAIDYDIGADNSEITNSRFVDNTVTVFGGAIHSLAELSIYDSIFEDNAAEEYDGGGSVFAGTGGAMATEGDTYIVNTIIDGNRAFEGGGISHVSSPAANGGIAIEDASIVNNLAARGGGIVSNSANFSDFQATIENSSIIGNTATEFGGGVIGDVSQFGANAVGISRSTIAHNVSPAHAQLYGLGGGAIQVRNSIVDWTGPVSPQCTDTEFRGGSVIRDVAACADADATDDGDDFNGGDILNRNLGTVAVPVGNGHLGLLITPNHPAASFWGTCGGQDGRGVDRVSPCASGAIDDGFLAMAGDSVDANPGDGLCANSLGDCSIRAAVMELNALGGGSVEIGTAGDEEIFIQDLPVVNGGGEMAVTSNIVMLPNPLNATADQQPILQGSVADERVFSVNDRLSLVNLHLRGVTVPGDGGLVMVNPGASLQLESGELAAAQAQRGGAIFANSGVVELDDMVITQTTARDYGGAIAGVGGTLVIIRDSAIGVDGAANHAADGGGAIALFDASGVLLETSTLTDNTAGTDNPAGELDDNDIEGGAIRLDTGTAAIVRGTEFSGNVAAIAGQATRGFGGAIWAAGDNRIIIEPYWQFLGGAPPAFTGNFGSLSGGALALSDGDAPGTAPASTTRVRVTGTDFENNRSRAGGAISMEGDVDLAMVDGLADSNLTTGLGGGIRTTGARLSISGLLFSNNSSVIAHGGAIAAAGSAILGVLDTTFADNGAATVGGAVSLAEDVSAWIEDSSFTANVADSGGGLWVTGAAAVTLDSNEWQSNTVSVDGGALAVVGDGTNVVSAVNQVFTLNSADGNGGGVSAVSVAELDLRGSEFTTNSATDGGGLYVTDADVAIPGIVVDGNIATSDGGGVYAERVGSTQFAAGSIVTNNVADHVGGGVYAGAGSRAGAVFVMPTSTVTNNTSSLGGGLALNGIGATVTDSLIRGNEAINTNNPGRTEGGGGVYANGNEVQQTYSRTTFVDNVADGLVGGGVFARSDGGTEPLFFNSTIADNRSRFGGGMFVLDNSGVRLNFTTVFRNTATDDAGGLDGGVTVGVTNSIVAGNTAPTSPDCSGDVDLFASLIGDSSDCVVTDTNANSLVDVDPLLDPVLVSNQDVAGNNTIPLTGFAAVPANSSPAVDALAACLSPSEDIFRQPRPGGGTTRCDIGSFEVQDPDPNTDPALTVTLNVDKAVVGPGATIVSTADLAANTLASAGTSDGTVNGTPLNTIPLNTIPLNTIPLNTIPLNTIPLNTISVDDPIVRPALAGITANELSLREPVVTSAGTFKTFTDLIAASPELAGRPVQSVSLLDALDDATIGASVASVPLNTIEFGSTPLNTIPLWTVMTAGTDEESGLRLDDVPWSAVLEGGSVDDDVQVHLKALCDHLAANEFSCAKLGLFGPVYDGSRSVLESAIVGAPLNTIPLNTIPLNTIPLNTIPLNTIPLNTIPLNTIPLNTIPLNTIPLNTIPLNTITVDLDPSEGQDLTTLDQVSLASAEGRNVPLNTIPLNTIPLNTIGIDDAPLGTIPLNTIVVEGSPLNTIPLNTIPLNTIDPATSPLNTIPLNTIPLNTIPLNTIPLNTINLADSPLNTIPLNTIETPARDAIVDCNNGFDCSNATLGDAVVANALRPGATVGLLEAVFDSPNLTGNYGLLDLLTFVDPARDELGRTQLGDLGNFADVRFDALRPFLTDAITIGDMADAFRGLGYTQEVATLLTSVVLSELLALDGLVFADLVDLLGESILAEVLQLLVAFPDSRNISLEQLLLALIPPAQYPWTQAKIKGGGVQAVGNGEVITYTGTIDMAGGIGQGVEISFTLPDGGYLAAGQLAVFDQNGSTFGVPSRTKGEVLTYIINFPVDGQATVTIPVAAPLTIGDIQASITVTAPVAGLTATDTAGVFVVEEFEPNDTLADLANGGGTALVNDALVLSHIGTPGDVDLYPVELAANEALSVFLGNVPDNADMDLVLYGPAGSALPGVGVESVDTGGGVPQNANDVPMIDGLPALRVSADRGRANERVDLPPVQFAGQYILQVTGYNGVASSSPYTLQSRVFAAPVLPRCEPWPLGLTTTPAPAPQVQLPTPDANTQTLFVVNRERYAGAHGALAVAELDAGLAQISALDGTGNSPLVNGAVLVLDQSAAAAAYDAWSDEARCDVSAANAVANAVQAEVNAVRAIAPLAHVVVIGADDLIPFARIPDFVELSNERTFAGALRRTDAAGNPVADELQAAVGLGYYLTDNLYADTTPEVAKNRPLWTPEIGLGRLVEDHADVMNQIHQFIDFDGLLDPDTSSYVAGYDFLSDGAQRVADNLPGPVATEINDTWTAQTIRDRIAATNDDILSLNAHYDHTQLLSAAEDANGTQADLFPATQLAGDYAGSIAFTMGCHSGLSVSDISVGFGVQDWAQQVSGDLGGLYVGNTGFGYGDTEIVALSETMMANFAKRLDGTMTIGQAMAYAKSEYAADLAGYGVYDEKVLMIATFYGMPMFQLGAPGVAPPAPPAVDLATDHGLPARVDVDFTSPGQDLSPITNDDGETYFVATDNGVTLDPQATFERPIQPRWEVDVTADDGAGGVTAIARGAVIEGLVTRTTQIDPVLSLPVVDDGAESIEPLITGIVFPSTFARVSRFQTPIGPRDQLTFVPGRFQGSSVSGVQTLFDDVDLTVYYDGPAGTDASAPTISRVRAAVTEDVAGFSVDARDASGLRRVVVLVNEPDTSVWYPVDLARSGTAANGDEHWTGGATLTQPLVTGQTLSFFVQVVDAAGNVGVSSDKATFHRAPVVAPPPPPGGGGGQAGVPATVAVAGTQTAGWYAGQVVVTLEGDTDEDAKLYVNGQLTPTPVTLTASGPYELVVVDEGVSSDPAYVFIDNDPPMVAIESPADGAMLQRGRNVPFSFTATDSGSGIDRATVTDEPTAVNTSTVGDVTMTVEVADNVGNPASASATYSIANLALDSASAALGTAVEVIVEGVTTATGLTVDWGDGNGFGTPLDVTTNGAWAALRHTYQSGGMFTIQVRRDAGPVLDPVIVTVQDRTTGRVKGVGEFASPEGALTADPTSSGRARITVDARYQPGETRPVGNTKFSVNGQNLDFRSTALDVLFIDGDRAQYYGEGTVNRVTGYRFTVVVIDGAPQQGSANGGGGSSDRDSVRIRIWRMNRDGSDGPAVYDNGFGASLSSNAGTELSKGKLRIQ